VFVIQEARAREGGFHDDESTRERSRRFIRDVIDTIDGRDRMFDGAGADGFSSS